MTHDAYMKPNPDSATFDKAAGDAMRSCLRHYDDAPADIRSILENIAIAQEQMEAQRPEVGRIGWKLVPEKATIDMLAELAAGVTLFVRDQAPAPDITTLWERYQQAYEAMLRKAPEGHDMNHSPEEKT